MSLTTWLGFLAAALFVTFTPGPAVLLAISSSMAWGPRRAMIGSLGNALGLLIVSAATSAGLGLLLQTSATAFLVLKLLGALYLIHLGVKQWRSRETNLARPVAAAAVSARHLFGRGLLVALTNPKTILFFAAFFPQFIHAAADAPQQGLLLTLTFAGCAVLAHGAYVLLAASLKRQLSSPRRVRLLNRVFGGSFIALGVGLLGLRSKTA